MTVRVVLGAERVGWIAVAAGLDLEMTWSLVHAASS